MRLQNHAFNLITATLFAIFWLIVPARSGDQATLNVLGFTSDGSVFAFEEYGVQDGSGFAYTNRFYIDTATDSFLAGSPVRIRLDDETGTVETARTDAKTAAQSAGLPGDTLLGNAFAAGHNAVTELSADPFRMMVNPRPVAPSIDAPLEVRLEEIPFLAEGNCAAIADQTTGFRLLKIATQDAEKTRLLHEDTNVPSSRNCSLGYRIGAIFTHFPDKSDPVMAVMIAIRSIGFEGPDYRWMAVATPIGQ